MFASPPADIVQDILAVELRRGAPSSLEAWTTHEDPEVRARAALALGRLKDTGALLLDTLVSDPDPLVRERAAFALGLTPTGDVALRIALTSEKEPSVRAELFRALGMHTTGLDLLVRGLDEDGVAAEGAAQALGRLALAKTEGVDSPEVIQALLDQIPRLRYPGLRRAAAFALGRMEPAHMDVALSDILLDHIRTDHDPTVRSYLVRAGSKSVGVEVVDLCVDDWDAGVRVACARAIGTTGNTDLAPHLETLLGDSSWAVRTAAITASGSLDVDHAALLMPFTEDPLVDVAAAAVRVLATKEGTNLRPWLDPEQPVQLQAAAISGLTDPDQLKRLATLSVEAPVRTAAAARLSEVEHGPEHALALLESSDDVVVAVGITMLGELKDPAYAEEIGQAMLDSDHPDVQIEGLKAFAEMPDQRLPPSEHVLAVQAARANPSLAIRAAAEPLAVRLDLAPLPPMEPQPLPDLIPTLDIVSARILTDAGELRVTLHPDVAPMTVHNFATLAEDGYFDGLQFHRVVPDFVIQDGCPRGDGWGGPGYSIPDELSWLPYDEGVLGMALSGPDTGGSQWFITLSPQPHLDANYTVFGELDYGRSTVGSVHQGTVIQDILIERVRAPGAVPTPTPKDTTGQPANKAKKTQPTSDQPGPDGL